MSNYTPTALQSAVTDDSIDLSERDVRALTQYLTVLDDYGPARGADDLYMVVSESGEEYLVDARSGACQCPDHEYRDVTCKHARRVQFATGEREIPAWVDPSALDDQLGAHVDGGPKRAAADGGIIVAGDDAEILDADDLEDDECEQCAKLPGDYPCADCYIAGRAEWPDEEGDA
jgi:hypothetical protein